MCICLVTELQKLNHKIMLFLARFAKFSPTKISGYVVPLKYQAVTTFLYWSIKWRFFFEGPSMIGSGKRVNFSQNAKFLHFQATTTQRYREPLAFSCTPALLLKKLQSWKYAWFIWLPCKIESFCQILLQIIKSNFVHQTTVPHGKRVCFYHSMMFAVYAGI